MASEGEEEHYGGGGGQHWAVVPMKKNKIHGLDVSVKCLFSVLCYPRKEVVKSIDHRSERSAHYSLVPICDSE